MTVDTPRSPGLVLVAHGTRNLDAVDEIEGLCRQVRRRIAAPVRYGWVEWDLVEPSPAEAAEQALADGADALVTLPFLAFAAGHSKTDVPGELAPFHDAHPDLPLYHGLVLGQHPRLHDLARRRIADARRTLGLPPEAGEQEALLVTGPGSSDPDANSELAKAARFVADTSSYRWAEIAFAGVTWPRPDEAVRRLHRAGFERITRFSWSLLAGKLEARVDDLINEAWQDIPSVEIVDAGRFGPADEVADAVADRYHEALHGDPRSNCDLCQFRLPLPGRENRAGLPSAGGTGERIRADAAAIQASRADDPNYLDWKKA
ncbi:sirohydrochlorin chelatase [Egibacter rhizosphaerae]|uniref:Sirohydrochlorin chelatase n=1 Tax=Egibacter rhizosphaerae TaxID=1670831 RepID=A0A411YCS2_9ACTN|nr:sirohydrochlorin chelatase [Egibacter rhizosphaerae]QBI19031.1 sirohydrochlorin chelatase [Egibacter rhizosphaerae]